MSCADGSYQLFSPYACVPEEDAATLNVEDHFCAGTVPKAAVCRPSVAQPVDGLELFLGQVHDDVLLAHGRILLRVETDARGGPGS